MSAKTKHVVFAVAFLISLALTAIAPVSGAAAAQANDCGNSMWLTAHQVWTLEEHQNWLETPTQFDGSRYVIVDMTTYQAYSLNFFGNFDGHGRFGVPTWWNAAFSWWPGEGWLLIYDC